MFDLIQSLGVPHTEVDLALVNGVSVPFDHALADGDRVSVYPVFETLDIASVTRVRPAPLRAILFLADNHLGALARLLRMLGFDAEVTGTEDDEEIAARSRRERRVLLTRDRELLKRRLVTHGCCVRSIQPEEQASEVLRRFDLAAMAQPLTRCLRCNLALEPVPAAPAAVPPAVRASRGGFVRCPRCSRTYWQGSHWRDMMRTAGRILAAAAPLHP